MDSCFSHPRLPSRIYEHPSVRHIILADFNPKGLSPTTGSGVGDLGSAYETRHRASPIGPHSTGLHVDLFPCTQVRTRKMAPGPKTQPLNIFIRSRRFRVETLRTVLRSLPVPAWATSIDLLDAYLHIPIHSYSSTSTTG